MVIYSCEFPLPPLSASPNKHTPSVGLAMKRRREVADYKLSCRAWAAVAIRDGRLPAGVEKAILHLDYYCGRKRDAFGKILPDGKYRPKDCDNARSACKALQDSLVEAGVLVNDDAKHLTGGEVNIYRTAAEHGGRCCVEVRLEVPDA